MAVCLHDIKLSCIHGNMVPIRNMKEVKGGDVDVDGPGPS